MTFIRTFLGLLHQLFRRAMGAPDNIVTNASKIAATSYFPTDFVIFSTVWNTSVTNSVGQYTITYGSAGTGQFGRPVGIYSFDGGITYYDFVPTRIPGGSLLANSSSSIQPSVFVTPQSNNDTVSFVVNVKSTVGAGSTIPLIIKVALLAVDIPSSMNQLPTLSAGNKIASTTYSKGYQGSYRQILSTGTVNSSSTQKSITTIAHGVGGVPLPQVWFYNGSNNTTIENFWDVRYTTSSLTGGVSGFAMDATNLYIMYSYTAYPNGQTLYRVYRET